MSETSSRDSPTRLKTLKEALKTRLSPEEWSSIFEGESKPRSSKIADRVNDLTVRLARLQGD